MRPTDRRYTRSHRCAAPYYPSSVAVSLSFFPSLRLLCLVFAPLRPHPRQTRRDPVSSVDPRLPSAPPPTDRTSSLKDRSPVTVAVPAVALLLSLLLRLLPHSSVSADTRHQASGIYLVLCLVGNNTGE